MSNPNEENGQPMGIMVVIEFDRSLLNHFTIPEWNAFVFDLVTRGLLPPAWSSGERPPPVSVMLNFKGLRRSRYRLDGINLVMCSLDNADFSYASLKNARLGCGKGVIYRGARLQGADFREIDISGSDFTGCIGLEEALFDRATYEPTIPPKGLPDGILALCKAEAEPTEPSERPEHAERPVQYYTETPLRCCVTIQRVPTE